MPKEIIIRGHNSYTNVLENSKAIYGSYLKVFLQISESNSYSDIISPLFTLKVGFIISKKKIKNAAIRNYYKRLLREVFRTNKPEDLHKDISFILTLNNKGYYKASVKTLTFEDIRNDYSEIKKTILKEVQ